MDSSESSFLNGEVCWKCVRYTLIALASIGLPIAWSRWLEWRSRSSSEKVTPRSPLVSNSSEPDETPQKEQEDEPVVETRQPVVEEEAVVASLDDQQSAQEREPVIVVTAESPEEEQKEEEAVPDGGEVEGEDAEDDNYDDELDDLDELLLPELKAAPTVLEVEKRHAELRSISPVLADMSPLQTSDPPDLGEAPIDS